MSAGAYPERYGDGAYILRRLAPEQCGERYLGWMNDPEVTRHLQSRFRRWDVPALRAWAGAFEYRNNFLFGIHEAASDLHVGTMTLRCEPYHHYGMIGFMIGDRAHWRRGAATAAITAVLDFAFFERRLRKVRGTVVDNHTASNRVFANLGFRVDAVVPDLYWSEGAWRGELHHSIDAGEWAVRRCRRVPEPAPPPVDALPWEKRG
jgi:[ribosomal protein S5]-alanine N-acetyltransferase